MRGGWTEPFHRSIQAEFFVSRDSVEMDAIQAFAKKKADSDAGILEGLESDRRLYFPSVVIVQCALQLYLPKVGAFQSDRTLTSYRLANGLQKFLSF